MELDLAPVALSEVYEDAERAFRHVAEQKGLSFEVEIDPSLPASIVSDEQRLGQVLKNLLSNAFKFTHEGGVTLSIGYPADRTGLRNDALRSAEQVIAFAVTDTGVGIPDDKLEPDLRGVPAGRRNHLAQVRRDRPRPVDLARDRPHARRRDPGRLDRRPGQPVLAVPAADRRRHRARPLEPAATIGSCPAALLGDGAAELSIEDQLADEIDALEHGDRVMLVIDSNSDRAKSMVEAVRARGGKAILARRASAALGLAREHRPSAVLLAGEEPRFESVLGQLKKHPDTRHLPVALVGDGAVRVDGLRAGAAAFIDDPVEPTPPRGGADPARAAGPGAGSADRADRRQGRAGRPDRRAADRRREHRGRAARPGGRARGAPARASSISASSRSAGRARRRSRCSATRPPTRCCASSR